MTSLMLLLALTQSPQVNAQPEGPPREPPKWEVFAGLIGGMRPDVARLGGAGSFGVNRVVTNWLRAEILVGVGAWDGPVDILTLFRIGARLEWPSESRFRPYLWVALAHNHEAGWDFVKANPLPTVLGLSEAGVNHRTGIDTGLGFSYELRGRKGSPFSGRVSVRASVSHLLGVGPPRYVDLTTLVGLCF